jgi:GAF domain-containing protein
VPLLARERLLGALIFVRAAQGRAYDEADLALADEVSRRATLALDSAQLYRQAQEAIRARDDFISLAAHELKTPITLLRGYAQLEMRRLE